MGVSLSKLRISYTFIFYSRLSDADRHHQSFEDEAHRQSFSENDHHRQLFVNEHHPQLLLSADDPRHPRHPRLHHLMSQRRDPFLQNLTEELTCLLLLLHQKHLRSLIPRSRPAFRKATSPSESAFLESSSLSGNLKTSPAPTCSRNLISSDDLSTSEKTTNRPRLMFFFSTARMARSSGSSDQQSIPRNAGLSSFPKCRTQSTSMATSAERAETGTSSSIRNGSRPRTCPSPLLRHQNNLFPVPTKNQHEAIFFAAFLLFSNE